MSPITKLSPEKHERIDELVRIGRVAVAKAQAESRQRGIPNVYAIDGKIYYELPNGELSLEDPYPANQQSNGSQG